LVSLEHETVSGVPAEGLRKGLLGKQRGEAVSLSWKAPDSFEPAPSLRGKEGKLRIVPQEIKRPDLLALDDAWAEKFQCASVRELREKVERRIRQEKERSSEVDLERQILDVLVERHRFDLPEELVHQEAGRLQRRLALQLQLRGVEPEKIKGKVKELEGASQQEAVGRLKSFFILEAIADREKLFVTEDEVRSRVAAWARQGGKRPERAWEDLERDGELAELRSQLRHDKAIEWLKSHAKVAEAGA
jgi:trigger factor